MPSSPPSIFSLPPPIVFSVAGEGGGEGGEVVVKEDDEENEEEDFTDPIETSCLPGSKLALMPDIWKDDNSRMVEGEVIRIIKMVMVMNTKMDGTTDGVIISKSSMRELEIEEEILKSGIVIAKCVF